MNSLRRQGFWLIAIILALSLGLLVGAAFLSGRLGTSSGTDKEVSSLRGENTDLTKKLQSGREFDQAIAGRVVKDTLKDRPVTVITTPGAQDSDVAAMRGILDESGANVAAQVALTNEFVDDQNSTKLNSIIDQSIPPGSTLRAELTDSGGRAGDLMGTLLEVDPKSAKRQSSQQALDDGMAALRDGGFVTYEGKLAPGQLTVVVTGDRYAEDQGGRGQIVANFAASFAKRGAGGVLVGRSGSAEGTSPVAVLRANDALRKEVSSVDNLDEPSGRVTAMLALAAELRDHVGAYGTGKGADSITVK